MAEYKLFYLYHEIENTKAAEALRSAPMNQYLFNNTLQGIYSAYPVNSGASTYYSGILSNNIKQLANKIWGNLAHVGFSGFDNAFLNSSANIEYEAEYSHSYEMQKPLEIPQSPTSWIHNLVDHLSQLRNRVFHDWGPSGTLIGLQYQGKTLTIVYDSQNYLLATTTRLPDLEKGTIILGRNTPDRTNTDQPVSQAQIDEWNKIFFDAFKEDPFLKDHYQFPTPPMDQSADVSTSASRNPTTGVNAQNLTLNGNELGNLQFNLPIDCQLAGNINGTTTENLSALTTYKAGNTVVGYVHTYDNTARTPHTISH